MTASPDAVASTEAGPQASTQASTAEPRWLTGPEQDAWRAIAALMLQLPGPLDAQLQQDSGLTLFEYLVLSSLSMEPEHTARMSGLARLSNGSLSRLSNVAKRLEDRGWISRAADPDDGRYTVARLTPSGRRLVTAAAPGHATAVRQLLIDPLTTAQLRILADIGHRLQATLGC
jgi:DNA-binding MarR family transcriptional regulator